MAESLLEICERIVASAKSCSRCQGSGAFNGKPCWLCDGLGERCDAGPELGPLREALAAQVPAHELDGELHIVPCAPEETCSICAPYWDRMRTEGYWRDGSGWTAKGLREMQI